MNETTRRCIGFRCERPSSSTDGALAHRLLTHRRRKNGSIQLAVRQTPQRQIHPPN